MLEQGRKILQAEQEARAEAHSEEVAQLRAELASTTQAFAREKRELETKLAAQSVSAEELMQRRLLEQQEAEKEKRIEHVKERAVHRLGKRDLSRGWQAWFDSWAEKQRHKRMLAAAAGRLMKPALTAALVHWRQDWHSELTRKLEEGQRLQKSLNKRSQAEHEEEVQRLQSELEAALRTVEQQRAALEGQEVSSPLAT